MEGHHKGGVLVQAQYLWIWVLLEVLYRRVEVVMVAIAVVVVVAAVMSSLNTIIANKQAILFSYIIY